MRQNKSVIFSLAYAILCLTTCSLAGNEINMEESLVGQGFTKTSIRHCETFEGIPFAVICTPKGSAFRRAFVKIVQQTDGRWNVVASASFSTPDISVSVDRGMLNISGRFSEVKLMTAKLSHLLHSNNVLLDDIKVGRKKALDRIDP